MLAVFQKFIDSTSEDMTREEIFIELMQLRSEQAFKHACNGFGIGYEDALDIIKKYEDLTDEEKAKKEVLLAAFNNIIEFSVAEEIQMYNEIEEEGLFDEFDEDSDLEDIIAIFSKYNNRYTGIENMDIEYAMAVAATLYLTSNTTVLTYMTQGDERVRPWHLQFEGYSAVKGKFPGWLVPPIEHGCRCYLVEDSFSNTFGKISAQQTLDIPDWFNMTFCECVAFGGRIFSEHHPYFNMNREYRDLFDKAIETIKNQMLNGKD